MMFTPAPRAFRLPPQTLTWYLIARAVEHSVIDQPELGWKRAGYGPLGDSRRTAKSARALRDQQGL